MKECINQIEMKLTIPLVETIAECPPLVSSIEMVGDWRLNRIHCDLDVAIGAVLEPYRAREARCQFAMHLRLGSACAYRAPANQVSNVLRTDHVQVFRACRQTQLINIEQQFLRNTQTIIDAESHYP